MASLPFIKTTSRSSSAGTLFANGATPDTISTLSATTVGLAVAGFVLYTEIQPSGQTIAQEEQPIQLSGCAM
jgi:hypothetical protein